VWSGVGLRLRADGGALSEGAQGEAAPDRRRRHWGVPVAEVVIVVAVWISLQLAGRDPGADPPAPPSDVTVPTSLPGFRSDAWLLPDEPLLGFVEVPAGPFTMGSDPAVDPLAFDVERWSAAQPQGVVDLPTFYIGRYEVTVGQYAAFVHATAHPIMERAAFDAPPDHPVTNVSWTDALAYARWLEGGIAASYAAPGYFSISLATRAS